MTEIQNAGKSSGSLWRRIIGERAVRQECLSATCLRHVGNEVLRSQFLNNEQKKEQSYLHIAKVVEEKQLGSGKSDPWKLTLEGNDIKGTRMFALFKPYRSKDLQGRRTAEESIASEYGGFLVSQALGINSATGVVRTLELGPEKKSVTGFLQVWVGGVPLELLTTEGIIDHAEKKNAEEFDAIALLDFLLGNGDRGRPLKETPGTEGVQMNLGNFLISHAGSPDEKIVAIDHGDAFHYGSPIDPARRDAYFGTYNLPPRVAAALKELAKPEKKKSLVAIITELLGPTIAAVFEERLTIILSSFDGMGKVHLDVQHKNMSAV